MSVTPLAAALPAERAASRMKTAATWLFVLPLFTEGVALDVVKVQLAGMTVLAFATIARGRLPRRAAGRIYMTFAVLTLIVIAYLAFGSWPAYAGTARSYDSHAMLFVVTYVAVAVFAVLFFDETMFERVTWRAATVALWAGLVSCAISRVTGRLLFVNQAHEGLRMVGTLTEPSAWAPVLALVVLLALRRRSWLYVALALAGLWLADSPTCLLVMAVTVPLYYVLAGGGRHRGVLLMALAAVITAGTFFVLHANPQNYLDSGNAAEVAAGRLLSGIRNVSTDGQQGQNARFTSTTVILADVRANGWMRLGAGPAADSTYFPAKYPGAYTAVAANALWVSVLFDFGEVGLAVLAALIAAAALRMRHRPGMAAILLPFLVAVLVNSAGADVPIAVLAVMLFAFGWAPGQPRRLRQMTPGAALAAVPAGPVRRADARRPAPPPPPP
jgi:hypothetical protein